VKVGDLIQDCDTLDVGLLIEIDHDHALNGCAPTPYCIFYEGKFEWHEKDYIENECEVISGSR